MHREPELASASMNRERSDDTLRAAALAQALDAFAEYDVRRFELAKLRCLAGQEIDEANAFPGISSATVNRDGNYACAWLL